MSLTKRVGLVTGAAALALTGVAYGGGPSDVSNDGLQARVAELEAKIRDLETRDGSNWLTERRASEIRDIVQDVLADADTRASLLGNGGIGYNNGFHLSSADGTFTLNMSGYLQTRFVFNNIDTDTGSSLDSTRWGFENSRTKLIFEGDVHQFMYRIEGNFNRSGGSFGLEDAWIGWGYDNGWATKMGQFKNPFSREALVGGDQQLTVERSISSTAYVGRVQGLNLTYQGDGNFRYSGSFNDGFGSANTPWSVYDTEFASAHRVELLLDGAWDQFDDFTSPQGSASGAMLGAAVVYTKFERGTPADEDDIWRVTGDISLEFDGANLFASIVYSDSDDFDGNPLSVVVQGGYYFSPDLEGFARYEYTDFDLEGLDDLSILTVGVNKYYHGHDAKWTTDFGYNFERVPSGVPDITGWRGSDGDNDEYVIRTQLQLRF